MLKFPTTMVTSRLGITAVFGAKVRTLAASVPQLIAQSGLDKISHGISVTIMTVAAVLGMGSAELLAPHF